MEKGSFRHHSVSTHTTARNSDDELIRSSGYRLGSDAEIRELQRAIARASIATTTSTTLCSLKEDATDSRDNGSPEWRSSRIPSVTVSELDPSNGEQVSSAVNENQQSTKAAVEPSPYDSLDSGKGIESEESRSSYISIADTITVRDFALGERSSRVISEASLCTSDSSRSRASKEKPTDLQPERPHQHQSLCDTGLSRAAFAKDRTDSGANKGGRSDSITSGDSRDQFVVAKTHLSTNGLSPTDTRQSDGAEEEVQLSDNSNEMSACSGRFWRPDWSF